MKAYMFNAANGLYEGETFIEDDKLECMDGITTVVPPVHETGMVPVFKSGQQRWILMPVSLFKEQYFRTRGGCHESPELRSD